MTIDLNHTIVHAHDRRESAEFYAYFLGLDIGAPLEPFLPVFTSNGVTLDFIGVGDADIAIQHYAFLVSDDEFDPIFERVTGAGLTYYPDPHTGTENEINTNDGGRGFYFFDPSGHGLEVITRPYGYRGGDLRPGYGSDGAGRGAP